MFLTDLISLWYSLSSCTSGCFRIWNGIMHGVKAMTTAIQHLQGTMETEKIIKLHMRFGTRSNFSCNFSPKPWIIANDTSLCNVKNHVKYLRADLLSKKFTRKFQTLRRGVWHPLASNCNASYRKSSSQDKLKEILHHVNGPFRQTSHYFFPSNILTETNQVSSVKRLDNDGSLLVAKKQWQRQWRARTKKYK